MRSASPPTGTTERAGIAEASPAGERDGRDAVPGPAQDGESSTVDQSREWPFRDTAPRQDAAASSLDPIWGADPPDAVRWHTEMTPDQATATSELLNAAASGNNQTTDEHGTDPPTTSSKPSAGQDGATAPAASTGDSAAEPPEAAGEPFTAGSSEPAGGGQAQHAPAGRGAEPGAAGASSGAPVGDPTSGAGGGPALGVPSGAPPADAGSSVGVPPPPHRSDDVGWFSTVPSAEEQPGALSERSSAERPGHEHDHPPSAGRQAPTGASGDPQPAPAGARGSESEERTAADDPAGVAGSPAAPGPAAESSSVQEPPGAGESVGTGAGGSPGGETSPAGPGLLPLSREGQGPELIEAGMVHVDPDPEIGSPPRVAGWVAPPAARTGPAEGLGRPDAAGWTGEAAEAQPQAAGAPGPYPGTTRSGESDAEVAQDNSDTVGHPSEAQPATVLDPKDGSHGSGEGTSGIGTVTGGPSDTLVESWPSPLPTATEPSTADGSPIPELPPADASPTGPGPGVDASRTTPPDAVSMPEKVTDDARPGGPTGPDPRSPSATDPHRDAEPPAPADPSRVEAPAGVGDDDVELEDPARVRDEAVVGDRPGVTDGGGVTDRGGVVGGSDPNAAPWNEPALPMAWPPAMAPSDREGRRELPDGDAPEDEVVPQPDPTWPRLFGTRSEGQDSGRTTDPIDSQRQAVEPIRETVSDRGVEARPEWPGRGGQGEGSEPDSGAPVNGVVELPEGPASVVDVTTGGSGSGSLGEPEAEHGPAQQSSPTTGSADGVGAETARDSKVSTVSWPATTGEVDLRDTPASPGNLDVSRETSAAGGDGMDQGLEGESVEDEAAVAVREAASRAAAEAGVDVSRETFPTAPGTTIEELMEAPGIDREAAARNARVTFRIRRDELNRERRVLAVANQKGGVGKSTTAVNIGAYLALAGARVLVVDLDPQGNASTGLGLDHREIEPSIYDVLTGDAPPVTAIRATGVANLHILPSTIDLAGAEVELVSAMSRETRLRRSLESIDHQYDTILVDCPPSLGLLTVNALAAADELLIPIQCEYYALEGLGQLLRNVELVRANLNPELRIGGIVLTMYDGRTRLALQVVEEVRKHFTDIVYQTVVPRSVRLSEAPGYGLPIALYDPLSRGGIAYRDLTYELAERSGLLSPTGEGAS